MVSEMIHRSAVLTSSVEPLVQRQGKSIGLVSLLSKFNLSLHVCQSSRKQNLAGTAACARGSCDPQAAAAGTCVLCRDIFCVGPDCVFNHRDLLGMGLQYVKSNL